MDFHALYRLAIIVYQEVTALDWNEAIEELEGRREKARLGGGQAAIDKQHEKGKSFR